MNIELRDRTEAHVRIYFEKTRDKEIQSMIPQTAETVEQAVADYRKTLLPGAASCGRTVYVDGAYVGDIWCYCIDPEDEPNAMLSYCLFDKMSWSKGVATKALEQFLADIVPRFKLKTVGAFTYADNVPSVRVLLKNGFDPIEEFTEDGILSKYFQKNTEDML